MHYSKILLILSVTPYLLDIVTPGASSSHFLLDSQTHILVWFIDDSDLFFSSSSRKESHLGPYQDGFLKQCNPATGKTHTKDTYMQTPQNTHKLSAGQETRL